MWTTHFLVDAKPRKMMYQQRMINIVDTQFCFIFADRQMWCLSTQYFPSHVQFDLWPVTFLCLLGKISNSAMFPLGCDHYCPCRDCWTASFFLKGAQRLHPPNDPAWDLSLVLDAPCRTPFEPLARNRAEVGKLKGCIPMPSIFLQQERKDKPGLLCPLQALRTYTATTACNRRCD